MGAPSTAAVILAAGQGTRMRSDLPKVLHEVCGRPMLAYVLDACRQAGVGQQYVVVGYGAAQVRAALEGEPGVHFVEQSEQRGTGHAVLCARAAVEGRYDDLLVLCGDGPLVRAATLTALLERHRSTQAAATLATAVLDDPTGYGRIVRDAEGRLRAIVEERDCDAAQRRIREVNPSYYCFRAAELFAALEQVRPDNAKGEYYLTDVFALLVAAGRKVEVLAAVPAEDVLGINSRRDLATVNRIMRERINATLMERGVTLLDPQTAWIDPRAQIGPDTVIEPFVHLCGPVRIGRGCRVRSFTRLEGDVRIGDGVQVGAGQGGAA